MLRPVIFDQNVATIDETGFAQSSSECRNVVGARRERPIMEKPNHRHRRLLRVRRERPRHRRPGKQCHEFAALYARHGLAPAQE